MHLPICGTWPAVITHSPMFDVLTRVHGEPLLCYSNRKINSLLMLYCSCFVLRLQSITNAKSSHVPLLSPLSFSLLPAPAFVSLGDLQEVGSAEITGTVSYDKNTMYSFDCSFPEGTMVFVWLRDHLICHTNPPFGNSPSSTDG